jgi:hypothetical protein
MNEFDFIAGSLAFLMCLQVINTLLIGRWSGMTLGFLKLMARGLEKKGGVKFLLAQDIINKIDDYLEYQYKHHSAEQQRTHILKIIEDYGVRIKQI